MSWESTVTYYQEINRRYHAARGGHHSAPIVLYSVDFEAIEAMQRAGDWDGAAAVLAAGGRALERAGAGVLLLATNTMHRVFDELVAATSVPWIHIADATGAALERERIRRPGLLGTRFTMQEAFYRSRLEARFGVEVLVPADADARTVDEIIFAELVHGVVTPESRRRFGAVMARLANRGADGIILGCTEIGLLVDGTDSPVPMVDTTAVHVERAVEWLLREVPE